MSGENLIGKTLGNRYEILELIGSGGMATVYKARCNLLNRYVAVKVLRDSLENDEAIVKNFKKEAQASASISHTNIVSVYDVGEEDGILYMVMEYVDGITLKEYIKQHAPLPWQEACGFAIQICQGLSEAHKNGIVHRDIKPQNILMTNDNILKVTDFGIARAAASETSVAGGGVVGSVHYISPEQARGGYTDLKSDIYSLGVVLYEMLTGKVPFDGETAVAVALQHLEKEPAPAKCINMDIPSDLSYITMKAMSKEQMSRYASAEEMVEDLRAVLADEPLPSTEKTADEIVTADNLEETKKMPSVEKITPETSVQEISTTPLTRGGEREEVAEKKGKKTKKTKTKQQKKEDKLAVVLAVVTILVVALIAGGVYFYLNSAKELTVPDFSNKTLDEAKTLANGEGFKISDNMEYSLSDTVEEGKVVSQNPEAGKKVKKNNEIKLVMSLGSTGGNIVVPSVIGKNEQEAIEMLLEKGLLYAVSTEPSDTVESGLVSRQLPATGTKVKEEEVVTIYISSGKDGEDPENKTMKEVPNIVGKTRAQAEALIVEQGFEVGSVGRKYSTEIGNTVLSQSPVGGKMAEEGSKINLVIANGEAPIESKSPAKATEKPAETKKPEAPKATEKPEATKAPTKKPSSNNDDNNETSATKVPVREEATTTKSYSVMIPSSADDNVNVKIVADGKTIHQGTHSKSEGAVTVNITGSGTKSIEAYIDGQKVDSTTLDFD